MRKLTRDEVTFELSVDFDHLRVRGNAMASGDDEFDREVEDEILARLERGDVWAWAAVTVCARWRSYSAYDSIGAVSCADEEDFRSSGIYDDMCGTALGLLNERLEQVARELEALR